MKKCCVIIPYYGKWPSFLSAFLKSCANNRHISITFFTDLLPPSEYPSNVHFHSFPFSDIKLRLDNLLGFDSAITTPYKLCDVRPAFGLIFKEYIVDFDFWGWGDIDLVYGNLNFYLTPKVLDEYDVISFRKKWLSGSLCFIRNNELLTNLFLQAQDLKSIFATPAYKGFDEISRCWHEVRTLDFDTIQWPTDNFTLLLRKAESKGEARLYFNDFAKESIPASEFLIWNSQSLQNNKGAQYSHYHFITEKREPYFVYPPEKKVIETHYIDKAGFYSEKEFGNHILIKSMRIVKALPSFLSTYVSNKMVAMKEKMSNIMSH